MGKYSGTAFNRRERRQHWRWNARTGEWSRRDLSTFWRAMILCAVVIVIGAGMLTLGGCKTTTGTDNHAHSVTLQPGTGATPRGCKPIADAPGVCSVPMSGKHYRGCEVLYGPEGPLWQCSPDDGWQSLPGGFDNVTGAGASKKRTHYEPCWIHTGDTSYIACRNGSRWFKESS